MAQCDMQGELRGDLKASFFKMKPQDQDVLRTICDANGFTLEEVLDVGSGNGITGVEMFLSNFPRIHCMQFFPSITSLNLTYQDISRIEGLESCPAIEQLWLCNNSIERIENLGHLLRLRKLFLHCNRISTIENLDSLERLEVLWLADNRIRTLDGLGGHLKNLTELNVARNSISEIGDALPPLPCLRVLNASDNMIGSFKEICYLTRLPQLRDLRFNDPQYGNNPLANLYNYQTYILFVLPHLEVLDTVVLSADTKQMARVTYMKKKMYYNMKAKTIRRNATTIMRLATRGRDVLMMRASRANVGILKAYKDASAMLEEEENGMVAQHPTLDADDADASADDDDDDNLRGIRASETETATAVDRDEAMRGGRCDVDGASSGSCGIIARRRQPLSRVELVQLRSKVASLEACLSKKWASVYRRRHAFEQASRQMIHNSDVLVRRVLLELESGGNIRLEEGRKEDLWFTSCADLLTSRFHSYDYNALGVTGVSVVRVTRIHNRCLRNVFDTKCNGGTAPTPSSSSRDRVGASAAAAGDAGGRYNTVGRSASGGAVGGAGGGTGSIEHLFYGVRPGVTGDFQRIVEEGFRLSTDSGDEAVVLSNSVNLTDMERLIRTHPSYSRSVSQQGDHHHHDRHHGTGVSGTNTGDHMGMGYSEDRDDGWRTGQLIVAKVNLGTYVPDTSVTVPGGITSLRGSSKLPPLSRARFSKFDSVYRTKLTDTKQRLWYIFDPAAVLPEYIVEFRYQVKGRCGLPLEQRVLSCEPALAAMGAEMMAVASPMMNFILAVHDASAASSPVSSLQRLEREGPKAINTIDRLIGSGDSGGSIEPNNAKNNHAMMMITTMEDNEFEATMLRPPLLSQRPKLTEGIKEQVLLRFCPPRIAKTQIATGASPLSGLVVLNLHACGVRKMEGFQSLSNLRELILSFNEISKMEGLSELTRIEKLDVGHNAIRRIEGLRGLSQLTRLDLQHNSIVRLEDLNVLKKSVPQLQTLDLRENDVQESKSYRGLVLRRLFALVELDGIRVTKEEVAAAMESSSTLTLGLIAENAYTKKRTAWNLSADLRAGGGVCVAASGDGGIGGNGWTANVEEVSLENQNIRRIQNLETFGAMRVANFRDNEISRIEGLESCLHLEELCLEGNRITTIEGLDGLQQLRKLELGRNRISSLTRLEHLKHLVQLSVEDNDIRSLSGLGSLHSLMELYIGNNTISELREVQQLRELPKLIILDLLGNPVYLEEDSRHYIVYHLRKLKVLDGLAIEAAEQAQAKAKFAGKLTMEIVEDKLGQQFYEQMTQLDLSALKIRDLGGLFRRETTEFAQLRELNLENNYLTSAAELGDLQHLQVLRLNNNRLDNFSFADEQPTRGAAAGTVCERDAADDGPSNASAVRFPVLEIVQLGGNQIKSIAGLRLDVLRSLRSLFLHDNDIQRLEGLANLRNLQELVLDRNRVKHLESNYFIGIEKLIELRIEENGLRTVSVSGPLRKLRSLHLGGNRIQDMGEVEKLSTYTNLIELTVLGNPVSRRPAYRALVLRKLPSLICLDGANVTAEEREQVEAMFAQNEKEFPANERNIIPMKVPLKLTSMNFDALSVHGGSFVDGILAEPKLADVHGGGSLSISSAPFSTVGVGPTASGIGGRGVGSGGNPPGGGHPHHQSSGVASASADEAFRQGRFPGFMNREKLHDVQPPPRRTSVIDQTGANFGKLHNVPGNRRHSSLGVILSKQTFK